MGGVRTTWQGENEYQPRGEYPESQNRQTIVAANIYLLGLQDQYAEAHARSQRTKAEVARRTPFLKLPSRIGTEVIGTGVIGDSEFFAYEVSRN